MYKKHTTHTGDFSIVRSKRFTVVAVIVAACVIGTLGTYVTVIGPRLRAGDDADNAGLVEQIDIDETGNQLLPGIDEPVAEDETKGESDGDDEVDSEENQVDVDDTDSITDAEKADSASQPKEDEKKDTVQQLPDDSGGYTASWSSNVLAGRSFYLGSHNPAATTADAWRATKPADAAYMDTVAAPAKGIWLVRGISNISSYVSSNTNAAAAQGKVPIFVLYGMPSAGCGGAASAAADSYLSWVDQIDAAITNNVVIIIEPDELPLTQCGGSAETGREQILRSAVSKLAGSGRYLYIDAGHGSWVGAGTMAERLERVGVEMTQGFSLNVSNYTTTPINTSYGNTLSSILGGAHFVIDTSRNGLGPDPTYEWCNAPDRALGELPKTYGSGSKLDALMWVKYPGESDGTCNGGPNEGEWWPEYALDLAKNAE